MITVRHLAVDDLDLAYRIRRQVFVDEQQVPQELEWDDHDRVCEHFLAFCGDQPAATGRYRKLLDRVKFERIATLATFRRRGVGRALMLAMEEAARTQVPDLPGFMSAQVHAVPFYRRLGWRDEGPVYDDAGIPHVDMWKPALGSSAEP